MLVSILNVRTGDLSLSCWTKEWVAKPKILSLVFILNEVENFHIGWNLVVLFSLCEHVVVWDIDYLLIKLEIKHLFWATSNSSLLVWLDSECNAMCLLEGWQVLVYFCIRDFVCIGMELIAVLLNPFLLFGRDVPTHSVWHWHKMLALAILTCNLDEFLCDSRWKMNLSAVVFFIEARYDKQA